MPNKKIFGIKNSQHVPSYLKTKKNWSKSPFFHIVGGGGALKNNKKGKNIFFVTFPNFAVAYCPWCQIRPATSTRRKMKLDWLLLPLDTAMEMR